MTAVPTGGAASDARPHLHPRPDLHSGPGPWRVVAVLALAGALLAAVLLLHARAAVSLDRIRALALDAAAQGAAVQAVMDALKDAETGQRGYLLTQRPAYLAPYREAQDRAAAAIDMVGRLAQAAPWIAGDAEALATLARQKMAELERTVALADSGRLDEALALVRTDAGLEVMQAARDRAGRLAAHAAAERDRRQSEVREAERGESRAVAGALALGVVLLAGIALALLAADARQKRVAAALRRETERLASTVAQIPDGLAVFDAAGGLLLWNERLLSIAGLPASLAAPGAPFTAFSAAAADWPGAPLAAPRPAAAPVAAEVRLPGRVLEVWRGATPEGGQILGIADVTQRAEAEAVARQAFKMEALGQLTGGVAHDFNNLLQVISANLELVAGKLDGEAGAAARLEAALSGVQRAARLTRHLLAFARRQPLAPETLDTLRLLNALGDMLHRVLGEQIRLELAPSGGLWPIRADPQQLENAILNLAVNARDAMPDGGHLTIEASNVVIDEAYLAHTPDAMRGQFVMITVTDTGMGMTAEQLAHAIEPFYTTKPEGRGTGLGLSMVYGFARQSGGHFKLYSEPGVGTSARLYVPRGEGVPRAPAPAEEPEAAHGELILVVEDDAGVRAAAVAALQGLGYRTMVAEDAAAALRLLRDGARPDLLFTDVVMPGRPSARELAAEAQRLLPGLAVVYTSGYTQNAVVHNGRLDPGVILVSKPWRIAELAPRLRGALAAARAPAPAPARRVLLVEDDDLVRMTTADMLAEMGHEVAEAGTAAEALRLLESGGADLALTDLGLPDMDGIALAGRLRALRPALPIVIASGRDAAGESAGYVWLAKPYDEASLRRAIAEALAR